MGRRAWILLLTLSALWGSSYMLIKVALDDGLPAAWVVVSRLALAAAVLLPLAAHLGALSGLRGRLRRIGVLSLIQIAGPFLLITFGERHLPSSLTGILVATAPIFTFLLAFAFEGEERAGPVGLAGVAIGIGGVGLLLGVDAGGSADVLLGGLMVILAALGYAVAAWYLKRRLSDAEPLGVLAVNMAISTTVTAPLLIVDVPTSVPGVDTLAAIVALGVLCTGAAFVIFYTLVSTEGPARASLVGYIAPGFSVMYGVSVLDESFTFSTAAGLVLILGGSWLAADGRIPWRRRAPVSAAAEPA
jgi:drug/metabolite transporter (DMT)-like permease